MDSVRTDDVLLRDADRDPSAFTELYERHVGTVYAWLQRRIEWAAGDLTAETFARDPRTYTPLEVDYHGYLDNGVSHKNGLTRFEFLTYQWSPIIGHARLLRLVIPRAARVDSSRAAYWNAATEFVPPQ